MTKLNTCNPKEMPSAGSRESVSGLVVTELGVVFDQAGCVTTKSD